MPSYRPLDYLNLDNLLSEAEILVRDTVRNRVGERYLPMVMEHWEAGSTTPKSRWPSATTWAWP